jgi:hypothetical protein
MRGHRKCRFRSYGKAKRAIGRAVSNQDIDRQADLLVEEHRDEHVLEETVNGHAGEQCMPTIVRFRLTALPSEGSLDAIKRFIATRWIRAECRPDRKASGARPAA